MLTLEQQRWLEVALSSLCFLERSVNLGGYSSSPFVCSLLCDRLMGDHSPTGSGASEWSLLSVPEQELFLGESPGYAQPVNDSPRKIDGSRSNNDRLPPVPYVNDGPTSVTGFLDRVSASYSFAGSSVPQTRLSTKVQGVSVATSPSPADQPSPFPHLV